MGSNLFIENYIKQIESWDQTKLWSEYNKLCSEKKKLWREKAFSIACLLREINLKKKGDR